MLDANLQETLARYSDPSRNPYARILRSQPSEPSASQCLVRPLHPKFDLSFDTHPTKQSRSRSKLDIETVEQPPSRILQVFDSRGYYTQSLSLRTHSQLCVQRREHLNSVASSRGTDVDLRSIPPPTRASAPSGMKHARVVSDVALRPLSIQTNVLQARIVKPSASGSLANPIIIADKLRSWAMPEISRPTNTSDKATEKEMRMEKREKERREAERTETERRESATNEAERTRTEGRGLASDCAKGTEAKRCESAMELEAERIETATCESATTGAKRSKPDTREPATTETEKMTSETSESASNKAATEEEPRASTTPKLLRIERKINNKDLFMGWYMSESSSELRCPSECIAPKVGDVYVHRFRKEGFQRFQLWVRQINRGMNIWVKAQIFHIHPKMVDRRLTLSTTGEPYWATRTSLMASGSRERASKVAEMIFYD